MTLQPAQRETNTTRHARRLPKRLSRESLIEWLTRAMQRDLDHGDLVNAAWLAQLILNVKRVASNP